MARFTTEGQKSQILTMKNLGIASSVVARAVGVDRTTVNRIYRRYLKPRATYPKAIRTGRPRRMTARDDRRALIGLTKLRFGNAAELQREYFPHLHPDTIRRHLRELGLMARRHGLEYIWRRPGQAHDPRYTKKTIKHGGGSVMVWGCITWKGVGRLHRIDGIMNAVKYTEILKEELLGTLKDQRLRAHDVTFQRDNDPKHTSRLASGWLESKGIQVLPWPSNSLDMNIIEHVWSHLDRKVRKRSTRPSNEDELWDALKEEWECIDPLVIKNLYYSMARRVAELDAKRGVSSASAFWPFPAKRFKANGLISAGGLGLENVQGRVVAFGDLDGDQFLDLLVLSEDQRTVTAYLWQHDTFTYTQPTSFTLPFQNRIVNVVPADLNYDGRLDLLFMSSGSGKTLGLDVLLGNVVGKGVSFGMIDSQRGGEDETDCYLLAPPVSLPSSGSIQPLVLDSTGSMRLDLLGVDSNGKMQLWKNTGNADELYTVTSSPLSDRVCTIADPHSNAVIDFNGDCLADLFLTCHQPSTNTQSFQIWTRADGGYTLAREGTLPNGAGPVSFADMDRDGTLDLVFPVCASYSSITGIGLDCEIHVAYNKQVPLCSGTGVGGGNGKCRELGALCVKDDGFVFDLDPNGDAYSVLRLADILPQQTSLLLADTSHTPPLPLPLRLGDANSDGFPDILAVVVERAGVDRVPVLLYNLPGKHGTSSSLMSAVRRSLGEDVQGLLVVRNVTSGIETRAAVKGVGRRTFKPVKSGAEVLSEITDARGVAFLDLDEDGTLDILVQRTGAQSGS
ncbi:hypothetical protein FRC09_015339, partial [Ceratobasidium sp. 395]